MSASSLMLCCPLLPSSIPSATPSETVLNPSSSNLNCDAPGGPLRTRKTEAESRCMSDGAFASSLVLLPAPTHLHLARCPVPPLAHTQDGGGEQERERMARPRRPPCPKYVHLSIRKPTIQVIVPATRSQGLRISVRGRSGRQTHPHTAAQSNSVQIWSSFHGQPSSCPHEAVPIG